MNAVKCRFHACMETLSFPASKQAVILASVLYLAVFAQHGTNQAEAVEYQFETLQIPGAVSTIPQDINNHGDVAGYFLDFDEFSYGFVLQDGQLSVPDVEFDDVTFTGINDSGVIVGSGIDLDTLAVPSFTLDGDDLDIFDYPGAFFTLADGINNNGDVVGLFVGFLEFRFQAFLRQGDSFQEIVVPGFFDAVAADINDQGVIVGALLTEDGFSEGFTFVDGEATLFEHPDGESELIAINNLGHVAGNNFREDGSSAAFVYDGNTFTDISFPGADETVLWGMNDHGAIVGTYLLNGVEQGFIGTVIPEPSSLVVFYIVLAGLSIVRLRH